MDDAAVETCDECGFDGAVWRPRDAVTLLGALGRWWELATVGVADEALVARPGVGVWSVLEYGLHSALVTAVVRQSVERILAVDGVSLPGPPEVAGADDPALDLDRDEVMAAIEREGQALATVAGWADEASWANVGHLPDRDITVLAALRHAVHDASHHQMDVGRGLARLGVATPRQRGRVVQINTSNGGVPKSPVAGATVGRGGLAGDHQEATAHHGRPFQALCLWSSEVIAGLAAEGHPIGPGSAGENLTITGLDWGSLRPGARLRVGTALAEISLPAVPCAKQARWFSDGDVSRLAHEVRPDGVRWYAWVREPGEVRAGDEVVVQPR